MNNYISLLNLIHISDLIKANMQSNQVPMMSICKRIHVTSGLPHLIMSRGVQ